VATRDGLESLLRDTHAHGRDAPLGWRERATPLAGLSQRSPTDEPRAPGLVSLSRRRRSSIRVAMQRFKTRLGRDASGDWIASAVELPHCWSRGTSRDEALARLREEIRYRIEYCPCSGVDDDFVQLDVIGETTATGHPAVQRRFPD
jgi:hypothetical protein